MSATKQRADKMAVSLPLEPRTCLGLAHSRDQRTRNGENEVHIRRHQENSASTYCDFLAICCVTILHLKIWCIPNLYLEKDSARTDIPRLGHFIPKRKFIQITQ